MAFVNRTQWKGFLSHWLTNRIIALPLGTSGDSSGSRISPNRVLIKASHLSAPLSAPASLQNPPAASLINTWWMPTFGARHYSYYPDFQSSGKDKVLLHCFKVRAPTPTLQTPFISAVDLE